MLQRCNISINIMYLLAFTRPAPKSLKIAPRRQSKPCFFYPDLGIFINLEPSPGQIRWLIWKLFIFSLKSAGAPAKPGTFQCRGFGCGLGPESFEKKILARSIKKVHFRPRSRLRYLKNFAPSLGSDPESPKNIPRQCSRPRHTKIFAPRPGPDPGDFKNSHAMLQAQTRHANPHMLSDTGQGGWSSEDVLHRYRPRSASDPLCFTCISTLQASNFLIKHFWPLVPLLKLFNELISTCS